MVELEKLVSRIEADITDYRAKMRQVERSARRTGEKGGKSLNKLSGGLKNAASSAAVLNGPLSGTAGRLSSLGAALTKFNPALIAATVTFGGLFLVVSKSDKVFANMERQLGRLEGLVRSTGAAAGKTTDDVDVLAKGVARSTLQSVSQMRAAAGVLLTFKTISGDTFETTLKLAADMGEVMGIDAKNAALQLAKALEEPAIGLSALRRSGVSFNKTEQEKIKLLAESGELLEAQRLILDKVQGQLGGAGAKAAGGVAGAADSLSQSYEELSERIGAFTAPIKAKGFAVLDTVIRKLTDSIPQAEDAIENLSDSQVRLASTMTDLRARADRQTAADKKAAEEAEKSEMKRAKGVQQIIKAQLDKVRTLALSEEAVDRLRAKEAGANQEELNNLGVLQKINAALEDRKRRIEAIENLKTERFGGVRGAGFVLGGLQEGRQRSSERTGETKKELQKQTKILGRMLQKLETPLSSVAVAA